MPLSLLGAQHLWILLFNVFLLLRLLSLFLNRQNSSCSSSIASKQRRLQASSSCWDPKAPKNQRRISNAKTLTTYVSRVAVKLANLIFNTMKRFDLRLRESNMELFANKFLEGKQQRLTYQSHRSEASTAFKTTTG